MVETSAHRKYEFKRQLEYLRDKKGRGTELISLYIPPDKQISDVTSQLREEYGQASNIKSRVTRQNVLAALESLMARLKLIPRPPENGVVIFCGAVDVGGGKTDLQTVIIEPPEPLTSYKYHCDSSFYLEPLEEMLREKKTYGLLVLDRREATIGILQGKRIEVVKHLTSAVPGKQRKGGQSSHRFQQLRLIAIHDFYKRIGDDASKAFLEYGKELEGILIGGPSPTKEEFEAGGFLHHELQRKIIGLFDTAYTDEYGLSELVDKASSELENLEVMQQKKLMQRFMRELVSEDGKASYGEKEVRKNLEMGAVEVLLLSEDLRRDRVTLRCTSCDYTEKKTFTRKAGDPEPDPGTCPRCGNPLKIAESIDIVEELTKMAEQTGTDAALISTDFEEGEQLLSAFGGVGAILRYRTGV